MTKSIYGGVLAATNLFPCSSIFLFEYRCYTAHYEALIVWHSASPSAAVFPGSVVDIPFSVPGLLESRIGDWPTNGGESCESSG